MGQGQADRQHQLHVGAAGDFTQADEVALFLGQGLEVQVFTDPDIDIALLGQQRHNPAGHFL